MNLMFKVILILEMKIMIIKYILCQMQLFTSHFAILYICDEGLRGVSVVVIVSYHRVWRVMSHPSVTANISAWPTLTIVYCPV